ncbi:translational GTPase TypA [Pantoea sp. Mhis]|uniref:translational GTPase TypA n=1 Tax=Pantoea sp. Mhis TaxID=2576759 RepID=UPI001359326C|nr:translational GTPase TypA [Pantoea sp. Mhis]MXP56666.1 translational GTPase TypA [Pantoea sp. Mhis]
MNKYLRNIAIIAHVDHGKTTLVDQLLRQSSTIDILNSLYNKKIEHVLDFNELEKERGITIFAKIIAIKWNNYHINIIDTPGHADFSGEVERIMSIVDSVLLVVDAIDGPMPQTHYVTKKAFQYGLKPIVIINKIDCIGARPDWVVNQIFDLFVNLNASDEQIDFPIIYTSALLGIAGISYLKMDNNMISLYQTIIDHVSPPKAIINTPLQMQIFQIDYNDYLGMIGIGHIKRGKLQINQQVSIINNSGNTIIGKVNKIFKYLALELIETKEAEAGNIVGITGINDLRISDTICDVQNVQALPILNIEKPTLTMFFKINTSPFNGKEGKSLTFSKLLERLNKEILYNAALRIEETNNTDTLLVSGRGELHLSILIENIRREGYELEISRPKVIFQVFENCKQEPFEKVIFDIKQSYQGSIMQAVSERKGILKDISPDGKGNLRLNYIISSRALIGFRREFMMLTSGTGLMHSIFSHYSNMQPGEIGRRQNGVLISSSQGKTVAFALSNLQHLGKLFVSHGIEVYEGQIIGIHNRANDLTVNCLTNKKLSNMRASSNDEAITLIPPIKMTLEQAIAFIEDDELVEVTPKSIRIRKLHLTENERKIASRIVSKN